jgi:hypothetical protein
MDKLIELFKKMNENLYDMQRESIVFKSRKNILMSLRTHLMCKDIEIDLSENQVQFLLPLLEDALNKKQSLEISESRYI